MVVILPRKISWQPRDSLQNCLQSSVWLCQPMGDCLNLVGSPYSNLDRNRSLGKSDILQGEKGWEGCGLPLTTTAPQWLLLGSLDSS